MARVAPPAGAWIETGLKHQIDNSVSSRPPRARGLKHLGLVSLFFGPVAPPAGAWIETDVSVIDG